jgi:3-deoxy-D-manno-octulosonic-acid transferase
VWRLVGWLLNACYLVTLAALLPWLAYQAVGKRKYRAGWREKILGLVPRRCGDQPCIWLHAVSVGEVNLLASLLEQLERRAPDVCCVISTTTMTGFQVAQAKYPQRLVFYCPLDFSWAVRAALRRIRPDVLLLAELELWPNLILAAGRRGTRIAIVNGRLSDHSYRGYRRLRPLVAPLVRRLDLVAAQSEQYARRFVALGARPAMVQVTGSIKFDHANFNRDNATTRRLAALAGFRPQDVVFLAGSTGEPEEAAAIAAYQALQPRFGDLRLVLVPRHPERFDEVARLLTRTGVAFDRRSQLAGNARPVNRVLLVDCVGELAAWWGTAQIAFVGGSLNKRGGQNMIEPAAYGAAVCFGPNTRNFRDIVALLLSAGAAIVVRNGHELTGFVRRCLEEPGFAAELGGRAQRVVRQQQGATQRSVQLILPLIGSSAGDVAIARSVRVA